MCGIVGAIGLTAAPHAEVVDRIMGALRHRGPDSGGSITDGDVWLGFRRLSILDLRAVADQPMVDEASGVHLVFNGEIYNFVELRAELEAHGHRFRTTGDTEVFLRGWLQWGHAAFERCNGMWAAAIHDPRRGGVVLSRDRFGEKPLHYGRDPQGAWWFASEPATLVAAGAATARIDRARAAGFLLLGDVEDPGGSWFEGIRQVPPGTWLDLTADGPSAPHPWWSLEELVAERWQGPPAGDDEVLDRLDSAVRLRLRSDVEVGTSLSGGVDSSAVVAAIRAVDADRTVHTFTASFPGESIDEWDRAAMVGDRLGLSMHRVVPTADGFADELDLLVDRQGGPFESPTVYAQWCVMHAAHDERVTVLLDGQGADESWGGYPKYVGISVVGQLARLRPLAAASTIRTWRRLGSLPRPDLRQAGALLLGQSARARVLDLSTRRARRDLGDALRGTALDDPIAGPLGVGPGGPLLQRAAQADLGRVLLPRLLRYADRSSMAWSREVRLPFLDPDLLDVALRSGWDEGLAQGWTKLQLRRSQAARVPSEVLWRREKTAYETPDSAWLRNALIAEAIAESREHLVGAGVLSQEGSLAERAPWRVLTLSRFVRRYGLAT